jgi:hypothetical protein
MSIDPRQLVLPDAPKEWGKVPAEILARLLPKRTTTYLDSKGEPHTFYTAGVVTPEQRREIDRIAKSRWFLLKNDGPLNTKLRCMRCGQRHEYFTLACVERPFHGLQQIVLLLEKQARGNGAVLDALFAEYVQVGVIQPITRHKAMQLADAIRAKGERL